MGLHLTGRDPAEMERRRKPLNEFGGDFLPPSKRYIEVENPEVQPWTYTSHAYNRWRFWYDSWQSYVDFSSMMRAKAKYGI
ncbi:hypothetical protein [Chitinibacter tainanensis]|uniref:hypothetical protein n=1 Tax=Chitinibacter tainanensis TaxID=230667 RepID=UPI00048C1163|nr:hypothetical protein [Chitinibacter tainanensis]